MKSGRNKVKKFSRKQVKKSPVKLSYILWAIAAVIIVIGMILYSNKDYESNITGSAEEGFKQGVITGKNDCFLDGLAINDDASNVFACNTDEDCLNIIKEYQKKSGKPKLSEDILEKIKCLPRR